jgi:hypothetical protein
MLVVLVINLFLVAVEVGLEQLVQTPLIQTQEALVVLV